MRKAFFDLGPGVLRSEAWFEKWKDYQIIGVEADPKRFLEIRNEYPGILLNYAIHDKDGELLEGQIHPESGFIAYGHPDAGEWIKVKTITLDALDRIFGIFNEVAVWADIEGSELRMLKGAEEVLKKTTWINLEVRENPLPETKNWCRGSEVYAFLTQRGFKPNNPLPEKGHTDVIFTKI